MSSETKSQEELLKEQVAARAKQTANVAAATGNIAKTAFLSTIKGATTVGEKVVVFGSLAGFIGFFLPWASILGTVGASGWTLAKEASAWFWIFPVCMIATFVISGFLNDADPKKRILVARWFVVLGSLLSLPGAIMVVNIFSGAIGIGGYLVTAAAACILGGGLLQISDAVKRLSTAALA
jgi:hypothetical protein